jgi:hypothetical protein
MVKEHSSAASHCPQRKETAPQRQEIKNQSRARKQAENQSRARQSRD